MLLPVVDTLAIEKKKILQQQTHVTPDELRLAECHSRYNLHAYPAHNALIDALASAELLLAQINRKGKGVRLADVF
jgi:DNA polymerase-3 subunit epsilon